MPSTESREVQITRYAEPQGLPSEDIFSLVTREVPAPGAGEVQVRNIWMSVDPSMRGRLIDRPSYAPKYELNTPLAGGAVGQVVASNAPEFKVGDYVKSSLAWREYFNAQASAIEAIDPTIAPIQANLGILGMTGLTAYIGLLRMADGINPGETVFVSAAAGAVGAVACQIAKIKDARVIGSAGSDEKCKWLRDVAGVDATVNYKKHKGWEALSAAFKEAAPEGIDIYYENVAGDHLIAALENMKLHGRIAVCGLIDRYNDERPMPGPHNIVQVLYKRLKIQGFLVSDSMDMRADFLKDMSGWIKSGQMKYEETVFDGIENAGKALIAFGKGENLGKMLVKIGSDPAI